MTQQFENKVALVTGAGSGIGRACALAFAREGARVVVADVDATCGEETVEQIKHAGGGAIFQRCDVAQAADAQAVVEAAKYTYGSLDYACNNAGIEGAAALTSDYPEEMWHRVIDVNLSGVWHCMKYELAEMLTNHGGAIVNMASILGKVGFATASAYVAAKHGVIGLTKTAAVEYAPQDIRVNAVCPGFVATPMLKRRGIEPDSALQMMIENLHPAKRLGTPEEIAEAVIWLCSDSASFVTGAALMVDGGYVAQ